jgi:hypothetical protein
MSRLAYNAQAECYQAIEGGHFIAIAEDTFTIEFEALLATSGRSEAEALDELCEVQWWYDHLPLSGVYVDGLEQTDTAQYSQRAQEREQQYQYSHEQACAQD